MILCDTGRWSPPSTRLTVTMPLREVPPGELVQVGGAVAGGHRDLPSAGRSAAPWPPQSDGRVLRRDRRRRATRFEATPHDYGRMAELLTTYASLRLQVVDACVIALAERLDVREVGALDRRDFLVVAPRHLRKGERLTLLPAE